MSDACCQTHLTSGMCNVVRACNDCGEVCHTYRKHVSGMVYCKICRDHKPQDHMCFIQPLNPADDSGDEGDEEGSRKKKVQKYIFYDFDGVTEDGNVLEFHGYFLHGHEACYPRCGTVNPVSSLTM